MRFNRRLPSVHCLEVNVENIYTAGTYSFSTKANNIPVSWDLHKCDSIRDFGIFYHEADAKLHTYLQMKAARLLFCHVIVHQRWILIANDQALMALMHNREIFSLNSFSFIRKWFFTRRLLRFPQFKIVFDNYYIVAEIHL